MEEQRSTRRPCTQTLPHLQADGGKGAVRPQDRIGRVHLYCVAIQLLRLGIVLGCGRKGEGMRAVKAGRRRRRTDRCQLAVLTAQPPLNASLPCVFKSSAASREAADSCRSSPTVAVQAAVI